MAEVCWPVGGRADEMALNVGRQPSQEQLLQHIAELELQLQQRDEELATEKDRSLRARKKVKQLLAKLAERDEALAELRAALESVRQVAATSGGAAARVSSSGAAARALGQQRMSRQVSTLSAAEESRRSSRQTSRPGSRQVSRPGSPRGSVAGSHGHGGGHRDRDLAVRKRQEIVAQLEGHLAQMRTNLDESEREVRELEERRVLKEADWGRLPEAARSGEGTQAHHAALAMISHQVAEKRSFAKELTRKTRELEEQVAKQRSLIEDYCHHSGSSHSEPEPGGTRAVAAGGPTGSAGQPHAAQARPRSDSAQASNAAAACQDEALGAFLAAAGPTADVVLQRPALRAAFESKPPQLSGSAMDDCSPEQKSQALSLFTAWVAVAGSAPRAMRACDMTLTQADVSELKNTLEACGAQLDEWEMTRCPANDATVRLLFSTFHNQPLVHLNLSYNTLGPSGASALVAGMHTWGGHLQTLVLEMNGLGDKGCNEVAGVLAEGAVPALRILELGWNELSAASAPVLSKLLAAQGDAGGQASPTPQLQKLGLGGNGLGSDGAQGVMLSALSQPSRALELDLSMNHIGSQPLRVLCEWAQAHSGCDVRVSMNLEWNIVDDSQVVWRLAQVMAGKGSGAKPAAGAGAHRTVVRLANNELIDLDPASVLAESGGLVSL